MTDRFKRLELHRAQPVEQPRTQEEQLQLGEPRRTAQTHLVAALTADRLGRYDEALQFYTRALREKRTLIAAWVGQVQMLVELGEYDEARLWSDKALELFKNNGDLLAAKAQACTRLRDRRAAHACSDASLAATGSSPLRWQARGEVLLARGEARSRECFEKSLAEPVADWFDNLRIARIHLFHDKAAAALRYCQTAAEMQPGHVYTWYLIALCQRALGWHSAALGSLERCLELDGTYGEARAAMHTLGAETLLTRFGAWLTGWRKR